MEKKKYAWLNSKPNSAKTLIERAKNEVPFFREHYSKFEEQMTIGGYSQSTLFNYSRAVAKVSLHFKKSLLDLDPDEVNQWLFLLAKEKTASSTYFKQLVVCSLKSVKHTDSYFYALNECFCQNQYLKPHYLSKLEDKKCSCLTKQHIYKNRKSNF
ncbi:phage integrase N-terminal SAM-like domain-containing protein [Brumimicrobium mesophilum]|uniref:phage integrase N-terminal SAM-like domain-containing protein n=1 Tax=Brumimicrobium mesophilum TaxID=392717 RepID=UPI000D13EE2B|nr:hypothetical protein [Brumimicrobium mesophilum]